MKIFTAHLRPRAAPVLLPEAFSLAALLFGPIWLLLRRAWVPAVLVCCAWFALAAAPMPLRVPAGLALAWLTGLCGHDMVRWSLARRGYMLAHVLAARDADAAFARLLAARPDLADEAALS